MPAETRTVRHWRPILLDVAWLIFALLELAAMQAYPTAETIPFHLIWLSLTVLYGFRVWGRRATFVVLGAVMLTTGYVLLEATLKGVQTVDELSEVPLMGAIFLAMVWHARRHRAKTHQVEQLLAANGQMLERERRFIQNASHELRTPITVALGHAELVKRDPTSPMARADLEVVSDELERLQRLADRLLVLAAAEAPGFLALEPVDLDLLVAEVFHRWSPAARSWRLDRLDEATVRGDRDRLALALDTLIENAVQHTTEGAEIALSVTRDGALATTRVADRGAGIAPDEVDRVFDRFARGDGRVGGRGGAGLGLAIAKAVTEAHGGSVRVLSRLGIGSAFELTLPVVPTAEVSRQAGAARLPLPAPPAPASR